MKSKIENLQQYSPQEWDVGVLIQNDELFRLVRKKLRPETFLKQELRELVEVIIEHGNSIEDIHKVNKDLAVYAMSLCNHVLNWTVQNKTKDHSALQKISIEEGLEPHMPKEHRDSQSYKTLWEAALTLFKDKNKENYQMNRLALAHAKEMYESYCETMKNNE